MERKSNIAKIGSAFGLLLALAMAMLLAAAMLGENAQASAPASSAAAPQMTATQQGCWPPWMCMTRTPDGTRQPYMTMTRTPRTPMPTRTWALPPTWHPEGTCTPHEMPTWHPEMTHTPHATWQPEMTRTPHPMPTGTRPPRQMPLMAFMPRVQFHFAQPGTSVNYDETLINRFTQDTTVGVSGDSMRGWPISVQPTELVAHPGGTNPVSASVSVPVSPTIPLDVERVMAVSNTPPYTTTAVLITIAARHQFSDLPENDWADGPVQYLFAHGVIGGYNDGSFRPNDNVTRAQFAKMLVGAMGWSLVTPANPTFSDVPAGDWEYTYVETAVAHGVISGYNDGTFRPSAAVTRAQVARMVVVARAWALSGESGSFNDVSSGDWFAGYVQTINAAGVMSGYNDGSFRPYSSATRAQIAKVLTVSLFSDPEN